MTSKARSAASRANGAKSKGPKTEAGKAISARNSLKHGLTSGLTSEDVTLICEAPENYDDIHDAYIEQFQPANQVEMDLVEALAAARHRLRRVVTIETNLFLNKFMDPDEDDTPKEPDMAMAYIFERCLPSISLLTRYENSLNRTFDRTLKQLQVLQKARLALPIEKLRNEPKPVPPPAPVRCHQPPAPSLLPLNPCETSSFLAPVAQATPQPSTPVVPV